MSYELCNQQHMTIFKTIADRAQHAVAGFLMEEFQVKRLKKQISNVYKYESHGTSRQWQTLRCRRNNLQIPFLKTKRTP